MVAIKDFGMPSNCANCDMCIYDNDREDSGYYCAITTNTVWLYDGRNDDCPLIEMEEPKGPFTEIEGSKDCNDCFEDSMDDWQGEGRWS